MISTMRLARRAAVALLLGLLVSSCDQLGSGKPPEVAAPTASVVPLTSNDKPAPAKTEDTDRLAIIKRFDCIAAETGDATTDHAFDWSQGIRAWKAGGPGGATWNLDHLRCAAEVQTSCAEGRLDVELRIGGSLVAEHGMPIEATGLQTIAFDLPGQPWQAHLDQPGKISKPLPYRTASFGLSAQISCRDPVQLDPGIGPRREFADENYFTAGFASGE